LFLLWLEAAGEAKSLKISLDFRKLIVGEISVKVLAVYYSRTGNTKLVAEAIAQGLEADVEEIKDERNRMGVFGFLRCGYEAIFKKLTDIEVSKKNLEGYDLIIVGSPVWAGRLSSPVRTYLHLYGHKFKNVAFFVTYGMGKGKVFSQIEELCKLPTATLEVKDEEIELGEYIKKVEEFIVNIRNSSSIHKT